MKIQHNKVFNLMDTNGRRNDVINAIQGYLEILNDIQTSSGISWGRLPNSFAQYEFYKQAIEQSPDVFEKHPKFDKLQAELDNYEAFKAALEDRDIDWIAKHHTKYDAILKKFDLGIEDRARHYTSNLVKLGFTDNNREISPAGKLLLDKTKVKRTELEKTLPIDEINLIYLRQLLKLRIFDTDGDKFYSPFSLAIYILLSKGRVSENDFLEIVQGLNPYFDFTNIDNLIDTYKSGDILEISSVDIPDVLKGNELLSEADFRLNFPNGKSNKVIIIYWEFYIKLYEFKLNSNEDSLSQLLAFYEKHKSKLNKAFGHGKPVFENNTTFQLSAKDFIENNNAIFEGNLNSNLFLIFSLSKKLDQIKEYSDTTKRIFKASGIINFDNGYVTLAYKELCECIFEKESIKNRVFGRITADCNCNYASFSEYESSSDSYFCSVTTVSDILNYDTSKIDLVIKDIIEEFGGADFSVIPSIAKEKKKQEFGNHISKYYPKEKVKDILRLFNDRKNDEQIKTTVSPDATVSTIYEFMVGLGWYYFSDKKIDILDSFNLTLSADFEPLVHAGGGQGDIVIYEDDKVVMLEATLMNSNSQKRGEWEPVLRHSVNLKIDEESKSQVREVISFFIADEFDSNTINIWKAVATVPLQSSSDKNKFTENVVIMPIDTNELCDLMEKSDKYDEIIRNVKSLFEVGKANFDMDWRDHFIHQII